jgi:hypothetical protein
MNYPDAPEYEEAVSSEIAFDSHSKLRRGADNI